MDNVYDSGDFPRMMETAMGAAEWTGAQARRAAARARGKLLGIGRASYIERCGGGFPETVRLVFNDDNTVTAFHGTQTAGQGHDTTFRQVLSETFGIDIEAIRIVQGDTDVVPEGITSGSRSIPVGSAAMVGAAKIVIDKGREVAANVLEAAGADIEFAGGDFRVAGTDRRLSLFEAARTAPDAANLPAGQAPGLDAEYQHVPPVATFPNGCHICELEIDAETGETEITRYTIVDDFGVVINPLLLEGQIHGGVVQGIGQALYEHAAYDESGQLVAGSFMDYTLPRADHFPSFLTETRGYPCTTNPLGLKRVGEAGTTPATPLAIWQALQGAQHAPAE